MASSKATELLNQAPWHAKPIHQPSNRWLKKPLVWLQQPHPAVVLLCIMVFDMVFYVSCAVAKFQAMSEFRKTLPTMDSGGEATRDQVQGAVVVGVPVAFSQKRMMTAFQTLCRIISHPCSTINQNWCGKTRPTERFISVFSSNSRQVLSNMNEAFL